MADLPATVAANRQGIDVFIDLACALDPDRWTTPVQLRGWSPAQITDHLTRTYDFGSSVIEGRMAEHRLPGPVRWMINRFWFAPAVRNGRFTGKAKAPTFFQPHLSSSAPEELLARLRAASERFAALVEREVSRGTTSVEHPMFGTIPLLQFLELQVIHVRHHRAQLPQPS